MVRRMPWEQLMDVDQTLAVQCIVGESVSRESTIESTRPDSTLSTSDRWLIRRQQRAAGRYI